MVYDVWMDYEKRQSVFSRYLLLVFHKLNYIMINIYIYKP